MPAATPTTIRTWILFVIFALFFTLHLYFCLFINHAMLNVMMK